MERKHGCITKTWLPGQKRRQPRMCVCACTRDQRATLIIVSPWTLPSPLVFTTGHDIYGKQGRHFQALL